MNKIKSALISVYNKEGIDAIANKLDEMGVKIFSTGGTATHIESLGLPVNLIEDLTGFPEILGGRVKTLHPKVFGGILWQRDSKSDKKDVKTHALPSFDLVIVDLYPFEETVANLENEGTAHDDAIEKIDIGGVSLIRAAAKNYKDVLVIGHKDQYGLLMQSLERGGTELEERKEFAIDAFNITSNYDAEIFKYLLSDMEDDIEGIDPSLLFPQEQGGVGINISKDDIGLNDFLICWDKFGHRPNRLLIQNTYSTKLFNETMADRIQEKNVFTDIMPDSEELIINDRIFAKLDEGCYMSYVVVDRNMENSFIDSVMFFYTKNNETVNEYIDLLNECVLDFDEDSTNKLNTVTLSANGLEIEPIGFHDIDMDNIDSYYNAETFKKVEKVIKKIKKSNTGMTILYGERGTGKTSIINHLADKLDRMVIFIPNNMIEHTINNPEFRRFIKRYEKPILVIDDCELVLNEMYNRSNVTTTNLVQMVDGFLASTMDVNIVAIFNAEKEDEIDHNLLECNSLIDVVEFGYLSEEECTELAKTIGGNKKQKGSAKMIDVVKKRKPATQSTIGF
jgi:hypothetical protein